MRLEVVIEKLPPMNTSNSRGSHWSHSKLKRTWGDRVVAAVIAALKDGCGDEPKGAA